MDIFAKHASKAECKIFVSLFHCFTCFTCFTWNTKQRNSTLRFSSETEKQWNSPFENEGETAKQWNTIFDQNFALCLQLRSEHFQKYFAITSLFSLENSPIISSLHENSSQLRKTKTSSIIITRLSVSLKLGREKMPSRFALSSTITLLALLTTRLNSLQLTLFTLCYK